jgi:hypothetical protein
MRPAATASHTALNSVHPFSMSAIEMSARTTSFSDFVELSILNEEGAHPRRKVSTRLTIRHVVSAIDPPPFFRPSIARDKHNLFG